MGLKAAHAILAPLAIVIAAGVVPALAFTIVLNDTVDFPFWDEWGLTGMIVAAHHGHLLVGDAWQLHNSHRIFFPTLLIVGLAQLGGWSQLRETLLSVGLVTLQLALEWRLIAKTLPSVAVPYAFLLVALLTFSFVQYENFFTGFQVAWFLINLLVFCVIKELTRRDLDAYGVVLALGAATIAAMSSAFGLCLFPSGLLILVLRSPFRSREIAIWCVAMLIVVCTYLYGYRSPEGMPSAKSSNVAGVALQYLLTYFGSPLGSWQGTTLSQALGALGIGLFAVLAIRIMGLRRSSKSIARYLPWLALCTFAIPTAALTVAGRLGLGVGQAMASRYTMITTDFWIGLIALSILAIDDAYLSSKVNRRFLYLAAGIASTGLILLVAFAQVAGYRDSLVYNSRIRQGLLAIHYFQQPTDEQLELLYPHATLLREYLTALSAIGDRRMQAHADRATP